MSENIDQRKLDTELAYYIEVEVPDSLPRCIPVRDQLLAGIDPRNDIILIDPKIKAKHFFFQKKNITLTLQYLGSDGDTFLNGIALQNGKFYILENADIITVGKIKILIKREIEVKNSIDHKVDISNKTKALNFEIKEDIPEASTTNIKEDLPILIKGEKRKQKREKSIFNFSSFRLIPYKIYGFSIDVALTYFLLAFVIPRTDSLNIVQIFLYHISKIIAAKKLVSLIDFYISFHITMILCSLILGTTPGAFLVGLRFTNHKFLRLKSLAYALLNIFALPVLIFDIPFYQNKNLKELLTFLERNLTPSPFFISLRRTALLLLFPICFFSPFFLQPPYSTTLTVEKNFPPKYKDVHTTYLSSYSSEFDFSLDTELNNQFLLLPHLESNKIGLVFYDLKNGDQLTVIEKSRISVDKALFKLRYSNPLADFNIPKKSLAHKYLKNKSSASLNFSLTKFGPNISEFGFFFSNGLLFKEHFLKKIKNLDNLEFNSFEHDNPAIKISNLVGDHRLFIFGKKEIIEFDIFTQNKSKILDSFTSNVLMSLHFDPPLHNSAQDPQILEVLDAFYRSDYTTLLTYYTNEANKIYAKNSNSLKHLFFKNIMLTRKALVGNKEITKKLDELARKMENTK